MRNNVWLAQTDERIIDVSRKINFPLARIAIFVVYFWFGLIKIVAESPANPLIASLLERTLPFVTFEQFIVVFGIYEMIIGLVFLLPGFERLAMVLFVPHMIMTTMPLVLLPAVAWQAPFVPTLEGQYIIKNLALIALATSIAAHLTPWAKSVR